MFKIANEIHRELKPLHEAWAGGIKLVPTSAYGVRFYQNGSSLVMHYDKVTVRHLKYWFTSDVLQHEPKLHPGPVTTSPELYPGPVTTSPELYPGPVTT